MTEPIIALQARDPLQVWTWQPKSWNKPMQVVIRSTSQWYQSPLRVRLKTVPVFYSGNPKKTLRTHWQRIFWICKR